MAHCPKQYCRLEIDDAETGERLTHSAAERAPSDFFHSRLQVSPGGAHLLSAGWVWHPWDAAVVFDVDQAVEDPRHLDRLDGCTPESRNVGLAEEGTACWKSPGELLLGATDEAEDPEEAAEATGTRLRSNGLAVYDVSAQHCTEELQLTRPPGTMMPLGTNHVVAFFHHPRLISLTTGATLREWPALPSGTQTSSIIHHIEPPPALALDPRGNRFAVAVDGTVHVVCILVTHNP